MERSCLFAYPFEADMNPGSDALDPESTVLAHDAKKPVPRLKADTSSLPQRCMAMVKGSGQHYTDEVYQLLRQRLRLASTIAFCGFLAFFLRNVFVGVEKYGPDQFDIARREAGDEIVHGPLNAPLDEGELVRRDRSGQTRNRATIGIIRPEGSLLARISQRSGELIIAPK